MNLQQLIQAIKGNSHSLQDLAHLLQQLQVSEESLRNQPQKVIDALSVVDPSRESLGYLFLLHSVGSQGLPDQGNAQFLATASAFVGNCEVDQIRMAPERFSSLCRQIKDHAGALGSPKLAILPLKIGLQKLAPTPEHVTPIHTDFVFSCLQAKQYNAAANTLQQTIFDVEPSKTNLKPTDLLLYCYYGGMIHIGRRRYSEALQIFLQGLTAPTHVVNAITVATYKKYALVSLIHNGSLMALPKFTPASVMRFIKAEAQAYTDLATAYTSKTQQDLPSAIEKHQGQFAEVRSFTYSKSRETSQIIMIAEAHRASPRAFSCITHGPVRPRLSYA
ncbi:hypothetical protein ABBQ38_004017 [Trebouxia sp. C0009 RCD-2024]